MDSKRPYFSSSSSSIDPEVRKGPWTMEEDLILINYIANHGEGVWNSLAKSAGLKRTGKSCRLRWLNYLRPDVRRGNITPEEHMLILQLHDKWGNRWSKIAKHLPGRTDNEIKNFWRTRIQKYINKQQDENPPHHQEEDTQLMMSTCEQVSQASSSQMSTTTTAASSDPNTFDNHHQASYSPQQMFSYPSGNLEPYPNNNGGLPGDINDNMWNMEEFWSINVVNNHD
uniref:Uncharacterized protein n=1 Tax=Kalanchoe fedtschenkoi TaxID=63787 RepID=A0A7N0VEI6_KALFE